MANASANDVPTTEPQWETLPTGSLGDEWDFEADGPLIGHYLGSRVVETTKVESGEATALQFAPYNAPDEVVFIWLSEDLKVFLGDLVRVGDLMKIQFLGRRNFTGADNKPRQIKQYKVQAAPRA